VLWTRTLVDTGTKEVRTKQNRSEAYHNFEKPINVSLKAYFGNKPLSVSIPDLAAVML